MFRRFHTHTLVQPTLNFKNSGQGRTAAPLDSCDNVRFPTVGYNAIISIYDR